MAIASAQRAASSFACCLLCAACLRFGYADQPGQAGRSGSGASGELDVGKPNTPSGGRGASAPMDSGSADTDAYTGRDMDAGAAAELPPTPVDAGEPLADDAGTPMVVADAGMTMSTRDAEVVAMDAGRAEVDAAVVEVDAAIDAGARIACVAGRELGGYCWFLGAVSQSCNRVCAAHGGFVPSLDYLGTPAQGGSLSRCNAVLTLLTVDGATTAGRREDGRGVGCHLYEGARWWLVDPAFSSSAYLWKAQRACSCVDQ